MNRRKFLTSSSATILFSISLALPHMARADISGLVQNVNNFCEGVNQMQGLLNNASASVDQLLGGIYYTSDNYAAAYIALVGVDRSALSAAESAEMASVSQRFLDCRKKYRSIRGRYLRKLNEALAAGGQVMGANLQRQLAREDTFGNLEELVNRILSGQ